MLTLFGVTSLLVFLAVSSLFVSTGTTQTHPPLGATRGAPGSVVLRPLLGPSGIVGSLQIALHNTMGSATGIYQQLVRIDSSSYSSLINSNWTNGVPYYTANGTPVYGWLEANASNASTDTLLWLRVASIPANGWTNVSIGFGPKSWFNLSATGYMGQAPRLSTTYAKFDNGAKVFNFYDNFAGSTLGSSWLGNNAWTTTVNNGFIVGTVPGNGDAIVSSAKYAYPAVVDFYGDLFQTSAATVYIDEGLGTSICDHCSNVSNVGWFAPTGSSSGPSPAAASGANKTGGSSVFSSQQFAVFSTQVASTGNAIFQVNYSGTQTLASSIPTGPLPIALALGSYYPGALTNTSTTFWIRERTYEAIVPTTQITAVFEYPVTVTETGLPSGTQWWMNLSNADSISSRAASLSFTEPGGSYRYTASAVNQAYSSPGGGFTVTGTGASVIVTFSLITYTVTFSTIPTNCGSIIFDNKAYTNRQSTAVTPGSRSVSVLPCAGAVFLGQQGTGGVSLSGNTAYVGGSGGITATFARTYQISFAETGLPSTTSWSVRLNGVTIASPAPAAIGFNEPNGTYSYLLGGVPGWTTPRFAGSVTVDGRAVSNNFAWAQTTYSVTFMFGGAAGSMVWGVTFDNLTKTGSTSIAFQGVANGSYGFAVSPKPGYSTVPSPGTVIVKGTNVTEKIDVKALPPLPPPFVRPFLGLPGIEGYALFAGILAGILVGLVVVVRRLRRTPPPDSAGPPAQP